MILDINNLNAVVKFVRTLDGIDFGPVMRSRAKLANLAKYASLGFPKVDASGLVTSASLPEGSELARLLLGDDFISRDEVAKAYGYKYSPEQKEQLESSFPSLDVLQWLKSNHYTLIATPPSAMNLVDFYTFDSSLFCSRWCVEEKQKFAHEETIQVGSWLAIRKDVVSDSLCKNWNEQKALLQSKEHVPMACELAYAMITYYKVHGIHLYGHLYTRTSSVSAVGSRVYLGGFDADGLRVKDYWDIRQRSDLGLSSSRKI